MQGGGDVKGCGERSRWCCKRGREVAKGVEWLGLGGRERGRGVEGSVVQGSVVVAVCGCCVVAVCGCCLVAVCGCCGVLCVVVCGVCVVVCVVWSWVHVPLPEGASKGR